MDALKTMLSLGQDNENNRIMHVSFVLGFSANRVSHVRFSVGVTAS